MQVICTDETIRVRQLLVYNRLGRELNSAIEAGEIKNILSLPDVNTLSRSRSYVTECEIAAKIDKDRERFQIILQLPVIKAHVPK